MRRPSADELLLAAEWVESYDPGAEDALELTKVAAWLRHQAAESEKAEVVKRFMAETGCSRARALAGYKSIMSRRPAPPEGGE